MPQNDGRQFAALLSTTRRADTIAKGAIAVSRRRQLARLCEALELMVNTPARTPDEEAHKEAAIADLLQRNKATRDSQPAG